MTKETKNIHQRINAIMSDVKYIQKDRAVGNQYKVTSHDAVTAKVRIGLVEHGVTAIPTITKHEIDGNMTIVDLRMRLTNIDDPQDFVEADFFGYGIDKQDKGPGKGTSYAKRYALLQMFQLETGDDPENDSIDHKPQDKKGGTKNPEWTGKFNKGQLQAFYKTVKNDIESDDIEDTQQLLELMNGYKGETLDALKANLPTYYDNSDIEQPGLKQLYVRRTEQLVEKNSNPFTGDK